MTEPIDLLCGWHPSIANPALLYGPDEGYEPLRIHIASWLNTFYQPCEPISFQRICITGGASQNLACLLQVFTDPVYTRNVWMVAPTYYLAARIMDDAGFAGRLRGVPEDDEGIDLDFLERELRAAEENALQSGNTEPKLKPPRPWRKIYKHVIYAVPTFANPSGMIMSLRRREALVRLARRYDALIVTDDVYDFLQWSIVPADANLFEWATKPEAHLSDRAYIPRLVDVDRYLDGGPVDEWGHAISNGSFSKLIGPGARTGWAEASEKVAYGLSQTGSSRSGGAPSHLCAAMIDQMFPTEILQKHICDVLQPQYALRYDRLLSAIKEHLVPLGVTIPAPTAAAGGYFIWITLPAPVRASDVVERAQTEEQLRIAAGDLFQIPGDAKAGSFSDHLRLCFAWEELRHLEEGVRRLARVLERIVS
ncbi:uncharacterized protein N7446_010344 [Penicillium canescens]|uniref:Aminotransferase class I/classII large domain-containing protein n=1 Tax=Penicillium canescens TaxID=5083 RepID=A0AAD6I807_PENCN|nr:uncharacterized protein N7446_010344 [Penicillium canescens]KAJ6035582.1 hypothetical protein N7460_009757 [Penicillium canescens]KAJ6054332.1 hypothetical protein N7446_010344 [Penicillium canescens]